MSKLFSIITITKDNLPGLTNTAKSIRLQSTQDFEWIIIDGASTDGTPDYIHSVILSDSAGSYKPLKDPSSQAPQDDEIKYTSEPDGGIYDAMNKGLEQAIGNYVIFMNAGDVFADADILELIEDQMETQPDFLYGDALETDASGNLFYKKAKPYTALASGLFTHHQSMIYKRDLIGDMRYDLSYKLAADYDFTARYLKNAPRVTYCPFPICIFESGGVSQQNAAASRAEECTIKTKLGICSAGKAALIKKKQAVAQALKSHAPLLYWRLKSLTSR